jgi:asparagine synthase (glutamine-hydrolysing)
MNWRLNRFCGMAGVFEDTDKVVRNMGRLLQPAPGEGGVHTCRELTVFCRNNISPEGKGAAFVTDADYECRQWLELNRLDKILPDNFLCNRAALHDALLRIPGGWVLAAVDCRGNILIARDRVGLRELYYVRHGDRLYFSTSIHSFHAIPGFSLSIDSQRISEYMMFRAVAGPSTLFKDVRKLQQAEYLVAPKPGEPVCGRYWEYSWQGMSSIGLHEAANKLRVRIEDVLGAVEKSTCSPFLMLSGGIDSSALLAAARGDGGEWLSSFTTSPDVSAYSEGETAEQVCKALGIKKHESIFVGPAEFKENLFNAHFFMEQPVGHVVGISHMSVYKKAAECFDSAVTGECADTLFGYDRFARYNLCWKYGNAATHRLARFLHQQTGMSKLGLFADMTGDQWKKRVLYAKAEFMPEDVENLVKDFEPDVPSREALLERRSQSKLESVARYYYETFIQDCRAFDALAASYNLEMLFVYAHRGIRDFAMNLSPNVKFRKGRGKAVLREATKDTLPSLVRKGRKRSGEQPLHDWFARDEELRRMLGSLLKSDARTGQYFNHDVLERLVHQELEGTANHSDLLWEVLSLEICIRLMVERQGCEECREKLGSQ